VLISVHGFPEPSESNRQSNETANAFFMDSKYDIHIGKIIYQTLKAQGRKSRWLAEQICVQPSTISKIYKKKYIDTELLLRISQALNVDLFQHYSLLFSETQKMSN